MARPTIKADTGDDTDAGPGRGATYRTPRWVKVFGIALLVLVLLMAIMHASGHGPGHHMGPGQHIPGLFGMVIGGLAPFFNVVAQVGHQP